MPTHATLALQFPAVHLVARFLSLRGIFTLRAASRSLREQTDSEDLGVWRPRCLARWPGAQAALLLRPGGTALAARRPGAWRALLQTQNGWLAKGGVRSDVLEGDCLFLGADKKMQGVPATATRRHRPKRARAARGGDPPTVTSFDAAAGGLVIVLDHRKVVLASVRSYPEAGASEQASEEGGPVGALRGGRFVEHPELSAHGRIVDAVIEASTGGRRLVSVAEDSAAADATRGWGEQVLRIGVTDARDDSKGEGSLVCSSSVTSLPLRLGLGSGLAVHGVLRPGVASPAGSVLRGGHVLELEAGPVNGLVPHLAKVDLNHVGSSGGQLGSVARFVTGWPDRPSCMAVFAQGGGGACEGGPLADVVACGERGNPNRGATISLFDRRQTADSAGTTTRPVASLHTGHAMLLRLQAWGSLLVASHAHVDFVEAYDLRKLANSTTSPSTMPTRPTANGPDLSGGRLFGGGSFFAGGGPSPASVVRRWRCGRGTDFCLSRNGLVAASSAHDPGLRLRLFHHDLCGGRLDPPERASTPSGPTAGPAKAPAAASCTRNVGVAAVVVDDWLGRAGRPRGVAMDDEGACLVLLDRHRLLACTNCRL
mmetsp:Transcript_67541/g.152850  ORF Transcript_67541/g.152850 Transcript_67541/m.152850 type:complete len:598 (+) Transcript_67541:201-1994(+)|eukprot:CAMPEP_0172638812 /NCGR_PEP_ID=MMETSP1068-20121228/215584_1 /TAXON_ID=35684 /ORGANISM="Pseudopedinella elastica, Strain CCMP716" /LENGTH=597 /DNA_ID=CAMNT_0013451791 /DNA_START=123 /DNA_END=1916 /DNA_ORIENTATION=+